MMYGVRCMMYGVRCIVYGVWCIMYGVWCMVCGVWCMVYNVWCMVYNVWCIMYGVWCMVYNNMVYGDTKIFACSVDFSAPWITSTLVSVWTLYGLVLNEICIYGYFCFCVMEENVFTNLTYLLQHLWGITKQQLSMKLKI